MKETYVEDVSKFETLIKAIILPKTKHYFSQTCSFCKQTLLPLSLKTIQLTKNTLVTIHHKQHWFKRCGKTMFENSVGLALAILATKIVQHFVEVREFSNLWGLFATRPVVSEATYETLSFLIELIIALMVFSISEHFFEEYRNRKDEQT